MSDERRRHPRLEIPLVASYQLQGDEEWRVGRVANLSAGGAALLTAEPIAEGSLVTRIRFRLPEAGEPIEAAAVVLRSEPEAEAGGSHLSGLHFLEIAGDGFGRIRSFVFQRLRGE